MAALFACTKCNSRQHFDDLSKDQQLCKACLGANNSAKCTYCRSEFPQELKKEGKTSACKKCDQNVKLYGKPTACEYCNIIAAFIGSKCQRCTSLERKYGPPLTCDQCKQRCAFDRKDERRKKVEGKLLCWLCTLSYKRALAKAKQNDPSGGQSSRSSSTHYRAHKHSGSVSTHSSHLNSHNKKPRLEVSKLNGSMPSSTLASESILVDSNSTDHMVAVTQLKEQIASLQKQLTQKDQQMLTKDKQMSDLKAQLYSSEKEMRARLLAMQKQHSEQVQELTIKLRSLQKQVVTLGKQNKKGNTDSPLST